MTRILITALVSLVLTGGIGSLLIPFLRAMKIGQSIREVGPTWHNYKAGTPMMGGLMFIITATLILLFNIPRMVDFSVFFVLLLSLCFGFIGFLDDYAKMKKKQNEGLTSLQKAALQMAVSALFVYVLYRNGVLRIPVKNVSKIDGEEVVQVYVKRADDVDGPIMSLRGFKRVPVKAGKKAFVEIPMSAENLDLFNPETGKMEAAPGKYIVYYGGTSDIAKLKKRTIKI